MKGYPLPKDHVVNQVGKLNISGNIIAHTWYRHICLSNGKPDLAAIIILAEIVYWYRPIEVKDEKNGKFLGWRKKFKADKLQRHYDSFSTQFGLSKNQVKRATDNLVQLNIIDKDFRNIRLPNGLFLGNILYIGLNVDQLAEITYSKILDESENDEPSSIQIEQGIDQIVIPIELEGYTNTDTTTNWTLDKI